MAKLVSDTKQKSRHAPLKVKRVAPNNGPKSMDDVAAAIGLEGLAKKLSYVKPKPLFPDLEKNPNGATTVKHSNGSQDKASVNDLNAGFSDLFSDLDSAPKSNDSVTKLAAYLMTKSALEKVEHFESIAAEATREYWKARRKLLLINKVLNSVYKSIENEEVDKLTAPSKEEINSVLKNVISNELFKNRKERDITPLDMFLK